VIEKLTAVHVGHEAAAELDHGQAAHRHVGVIGAGGMSIHSFLDGVALAAGLAVGGGLGLVIAAVVVVHRFSDGISVVSMLTASRASRRDAYRWVAVVAIAPVVTPRSAFVTVPDGVRGDARRVRGLLPVCRRGGAAAGGIGRTAHGRRATLGGVVAIYAFSVFAGAIG
jgi:ZIP family zinc transporter